MSTKKLVLEDRFEAYNLPLGCISHAIRAQAGGLPGALSKVGLDIFVDPRREGPGINRISIDDSLVKHVEVDGDEFLYYKLPKITIAMIKGTAADRKGNITLMICLCPVMHCPSVRLSRQTVKSHCAGGSSCGYTVSSA